MTENSAKRSLMIARQQLDKLSVLIINITHFIEGTNPKVDSELAVIRKLLAGKPNYERAAELSVSAGELLKAEHKYLLQQEADSLSQIENSLRRLNDVEAIEIGVKTEIRSFIDALHNEDAKQSLVQIFEHALELSQKALNKISLSENIHDSKTQKKIQRQISNELKELLSPHLKGNSKDNTAIELNEKLSTGLSTNELLECCLSLIRFVMGNIIKEAGAATKLINHLHISLQKVNHGVKTTIETSRNRMAKRAEYNAKMQTQLSAMEAVLSDSVKVEDLKLQTQNYLNKLQSSIAQSQTEERNEQEQMLALLISMQKRLQELEKKANQYKQKLFAQRTEALTDSLTKLPNRLAYEEQSAKVLNAAIKSKKTVCMAILDIDYFKSINDKYGHAAGDKTLQVIAGQFSKTLAKNDFTARWGGEEFVVLMPDTEIDTAFERIEQLRENIAKLPFMFKGNRVSITVSAGLVKCEPEKPFIETFELADNLLYKAKEQGRNHTQMQS